MEILIKCAAIALLGTVSALIIKQRNPEISFALSTAVVCTIFICITKFGTIVAESLRTAETLLSRTSANIMPMIKCIGIGSITEISASLCRDSSQGAAASALEIAGTVCAAATAAPAISSMIKLIGDMV